MDWLLALTLLLIAVVAAVAALLVVNALQGPGQRHSESIFADAGRTVEATESDRPNRSPAPMLQPKASASPSPAAVTTRICPIAPGTATARTDMSSWAEKFSPTPNISRMTPISASSPATCGSATKPGVNGPISTPASR